MTWFQTSVNEIKFVSFPRYLLMKIHVRVSFFPVNFVIELVFVK
jgi:homogentisate 1,2-dioxygenase